MDKRSIAHIGLRRWVDSVTQRQPSGVIVKLKEGWTFLDLSREKQFSSMRIAHAGTMRNFVMQPEMIYVEAYYRNGWICARPYCSDKFELVTLCAEYRTAKKIVKRTMGLECPERK